MKTSQKIDSCNVLPLESSATPEPAYILGERDAEIDRSIPAVHTNNMLNIRPPFATIPRRSPTKTCTVG